MTYLTREEFIGLGFDSVNHFDQLLQRAEIAINLFLNGFYVHVDFENDFEPRKKAVKLATAFQVAYLDASGITTAEDKQAVSTVTLGRTHVSYQNTSKQSHEGARYNLSLDAVSVLKSAGFGYRGVGYDRY